MGDPAPPAVLVVDDDVEACEATVALLESHGYDVVTVNNGRDAIGLIKMGTVRPHVIVVDPTTLRIDAWQFHAELLCDEALAAIPVIVLSADGRPAMSAAAGAMRAVAAIPKPIDPGDLLRLVAACCAPGTARIR